MRFFKLPFDSITCLLVGAFLFLFTLIHYVNNTRLGRNENPYI